LPRQRRTAPAGPDILILAVKPQQMKEAVAPLVGKLGNALVISIAAGLDMAALSRWLGGHRQIVRCMPNTPALIGAGITGLCARPEVSADQRAAADRVLRAVGTTVWIDDEAKIDGVTAISGSGPAYVFLFIEALQQAAAELGFTPEQGRQLAIETVQGAAALAAQSSEPASHRCANASPPRAARPKPRLRVMAEQGVKEGIVAGCQSRRGARPGTRQDARSRLMQALTFLLDAVVSFFCTLFLLRFMMQAMRVSFAGQIGDFVVKLTNWAVKPLRRVIPGAGGFDWASLLCRLGRATAADRHPAARPGRPGLERRPASMALMVLWFAVRALLRLAVYIMIGALILQAVLSWINPYSPLAAPAYQLTRPMLDPLRRVIPRFPASTCRRWSPSCCCKWC
jgi:pyrroline-5-carboxylate reductase